MHVGLLNLNSKRTYTESTIISLRQMLGLQEVGLYPWRRTIAAGSESHARSVVLPQLRADLVRFHEAGGCSHEDPQQRAFARSGTGAGSPVKQRGLRQGLQLPAGLADESQKEMQRLVARAPFGDI